MSLSSASLSRGSHGLCYCIFVPLAAEPDIHFRIEIPLDIGHQPVDRTAAGPLRQDPEQMMARGFKQERLPEMAIDTSQMDLGGSPSGHVAADPEPTRMPPQGILDESIEGLLGQLFTEPDRHRRAGQQESVFSDPGRIDPESLLDMRGDVPVRA